MNIHYLKEILKIIDTMESENVSNEDILNYFIDNIHTHNFSITDVRDVLFFLNEYQLLKKTPHGLDLSPVASTFQYSETNSTLEKLSIFCCLLRNHQEVFYNALHHDEIISNANTSNTCIQMLEYFGITIKKNDCYFINNAFKTLAIQVIHEVIQYPTQMIPLTLHCMVIKQLLKCDNTIPYHNEDFPMIAYQYKDVILNQISKKGIPVKREHTRQIQSFFKDTLYHEYDHACAICGLNIPHMLIASHIKPFRQCSHIFETCDYHNGILLCRNHDFLFDQGYISFSNDGKLLLSSSSLLKEPLFLKKSTTLNPKYLTVERLLFLKYHRNHIFLKDKLS